MRTIFFLFALLPALNFVNLNSTETSKKMLPKTTENQVSTASASCALQLEDYTLKINNYSAVIEEQTTRGDTIYLTEALDASQNIAGECLLEVLGTKNTLVSIEQSFKTSLFISEDGPYVCLENWKHHTAPWKKLEQQGGKFQTLPYQDADRSQFPNVPLAEFKTYVQQTYGDRWYEVIKDNTVVAENGSYPTFVDITQHLFRVTIQKLNGAVLERVLVIDIPVGC